MASSVSLFTEFARLKLAADGSDSYINGAVATARREADPFFYLGVFTTFYAPPAQDIFCARWNRAAVLSYPNAVEKWVVKHWKRLPLSGARRTGGFTPKKVVAAIRGWANFLETDGWPTGASFSQTFNAFIERVPYHGRYTGLKLYEACRRLGAPLPLVDSIVPKGGKTPRKGLSLLRPSHDYRANDSTSCVWADDVAHELAASVPCSVFNVEMLLCNFTKAVAGSYYPGHALDRDLGRIHSVTSCFGADVTDKLRVSRRALYPVSCLGETSGWTGTRKELERCYPTYGYLWSDLLYDYSHTVDLTNPACRAPAQLVPVVGYGEET